MGKNIKSHTKFFGSIVMVSLFLISINYQILSTPDFSSKKRPSLLINKMNQPIEVSDLFLPGTNVSVNSYIDGEVQDSLNATVLTINTTQWYTRMDYYFNQTGPLPSFYSYVDRFTKGGSYSYKATNYLTWNGSEIQEFDFWVDPTNLESETSFTVLEVSHRIIGIGEFDAWKINGSFGGFPFTAWYEKNSGLFLGFYYFVVNPIWYNLTSLDLPQLPQDYIGPDLDKSVPAVGEYKPGGTQIELHFNSLFGIQHIFYYWDTDQETILNSTNQFLTTYPSTDGLHTLYVNLTGNIGFINNIQLNYFTNNSLLGINLLDLNNNSKINGNTQIRFQIISGNGSLTYNWDSGLNSTVNEGTVVGVINPLLERTAVLSVFVKGNNTNEWITKRFVFIIDNTPPILTISNINNGSIVKGIIKIDLRADEDSEVTYWLNNANNKTLILEDNITKSFFYSNLDNGSYVLNLVFKDEANNTRKLIIEFSVYTSSFNWKWNIGAKTPKKIPFLDEKGDLLFYLTITSNIEQNFTMLTEFDQSELTLSENIQYLFKFDPDIPEEIVFLEFFLPLGSSSSTEVTIYMWQFWDNENQQWSQIGTNYNDIEYGWESTITEAKNIFALIKTSEITTLTISGPTGGGYIFGGAPSFGYDVFLISLIFLFFSKRIIAKKNKKMR